MTNVLNRHTCTARSLDLILVVIFVMNSKPVEIIGDMICGACVPPRCMRVWSPWPPKVSPQYGTHRHSDTRIAGLCD
jgi:hypothetical protein